MFIFTGLKRIAVILIAVLVLLWGHAAQAEDSQCVKCHTDADKLKELTASFKPKGAEDGRGAKLAKVERYQRVYVDPKFLDDENHSAMTCEDCHGGDPSNGDFATAHKGVNLDPSYPAPGVCSECHSEADDYANGLHYNIQGMKAPLKVRGSDDPAVQAKMDKAFANCARCHSSCGQCHINRPVHAGGGVLDGHMVVKTPDMEKTCQSCHGSGVSEFMGRNEGVEADVHSENGMNCLDCHTKEQMHGDKNPYENRFAVESGPACVDCHDDIFADGADNKKTHDAHKDKVSCYVCHAQAYTNCANCHMDKEWGPGKYESWVDFKIGLNPQPTEKRPEKFVTVRHVPVYPEMFDAYVDDALPNFNHRPTWTTAAPHTIKRQTRQNADCNNCHGNWDLFLMRKDVAKDLIKANRPVMVPPAKVPGKLAPTS